MIDVTSTQFYTFQYHFGTDMQFMAHLFEVSALLFLAAAIYYLILDMNNNSSNLVVFGLWYCYLVAAVLYIISGWFFIEFSYPDVAAKQFERIMKTNYSKKSYFEKYVIDNSLLMSLWFVFLGTIPFLVYPIWAMSIGQLSIIYGVFFVLFIVWFLYISWGWVVSAFPENMLESMNQKRATWLYDTFSCCENCCDVCCAPCGVQGFCKFHCGTDVQAICWIFLVFSVLSLIYILVMIVIFPTTVSWYLWFFCELFFVLGLAFFLYSSYSETYSTNFGWRCCTCQLDKSNPDPLASSGQGETTALLPTHDGSVHSESIPGRH